jgi:transcriptional regulator with XRE-family HTH domain
MTEPRFLISLGKRIRELRKKKELTQNELAMQCNFEKASLSRIEAGKTNLTILTLKKICLALEIEFADLFDGSV